MKDVYSMKSKAVSFDVRDQLRKNWNYLNGILNIINKKIKAIKNKKFNENSSKSIIIIFYSENILTVASINSYKNI